MFSFGASLTSTQANVFVGIQPLHFRIFQLRLYTDGLSANSHVVPTIAYLLENFDQAIQVQPSQGIWARLDQLVVLGMGDLPPLMTGILRMGI